MHKIPFAPPARLLAVLFAASLMAAAQSQPAAQPNPYDAVMAKASKLYYSTAKTGLAGFDCAVHPDWHAIFVSASQGPVAEDDPRIVLLKTVAITLHARMAGSSTVDWTPPANPGTTLDENSTKLLDGMHQATEQSLQGFMQFWTPFMDGDAVPDSAEGLEITKTAEGYTLHASDNGTSVTEQLDNRLTVTHYNVITSQGTVNIEPAYEPTDQGLLVNRFLAHLLSPGAPPEQTEEHVAIEYQSVDGFPIPAKLNMNVVNSATLNYVLDGCTVSRQPQ